MACNQSDSLYDWLIVSVTPDPNSSSGAQFLVTGANGFVGSALVGKLRCRGTVRYADAATPASHVATGDINDYTDWREALAGIDVVIHTAARVHVMRERSRDPLLAFRQTNVNGTARLAEMAASHGIKRFVYLSTVKVNGEETPVDSPFAPEIPPCPATPYGQSKLEAEQVLINIAQRTSMEVVIVRPPLVYGPGVKGNLVALLKCIHKGLPLPFGRVCNLRSMVGLDNLVDFVSTCSTHPKAAGEIFLISDGEDFSTADWIRHFAQGLGRMPILWDIEPRFLQSCANLLGQGDTARSVLGSLRVSNDKAINLLNWQQKYSTQEQIEMMCNHFTNFTLK
jgi:nucleoside-diphosphate-sugar epimerase